MSAKQNELFSSSLQKLLLFLLTNTKLASGPFDPGRPTLTLLVMMLLVSCKAEQPAASDLFECGGVEISNELQAILNCAGWLDFVVENVSTIEFAQTKSFEFEGGEVLGLAFCSECIIRIPLLERTNAGEERERDEVDLARLIVHEAAHLADNCQNGEPPALEAERAFLLDFILNSCGN